MADPATPTRGSDPLSGLRAAMGENFDVKAALGGRLGVAESVVPTVVFSLVYTVRQDIRDAVIAAVVVAAGFAIVRLARREAFTQVLGGMLVVGLSAFIASRTGRPEDYFVPTILKNVGYAAAHLVSGAVRWPLVGLGLGLVLGEGTRWRRDPARLRVYQQVGLLWAALFGIRLAYQVPLYLMGNVTWLGILSVPAGFPLFLLVCWLSWLLLRRVPPSVPPAATPVPPAATPAARE